MAIKDGKAKLTKSKAKKTAARPSKKPTRKATTKVAAGTSRAKSATRAAMPARANPGVTSVSTDRIPSMTPLEPQKPASRTDGHGPERAVTSKSAKATRGPQSEELRQRMIEDAAYFIAEKRGFEPGYELDDWVAAEKLINQMIANQATGDSVHPGGRSHA